MVGMSHFVHALSLSLLCSVMLHVGHPHEPFGTEHWGRHVMFSAHQRESEHMCVSGGSNLTCCVEELACCNADVGDQPAV